MPPRKLEWDLSESDFNNFLSWLDEDRESAALRYEQIRHSLIVIFRCHGCMEAEDLADEAINRVIRRIAKSYDTDIDSPAAYFRTVAHNLYFEYINKRPDTTPVDETRLHDSKAQYGAGNLHSDENDEDLVFDCLEKCLQRLIPKNRQLILQYYQEARQAKIDHRKKLAKKMDLALGALRLRAHRIREKLENCIQICMDQGSPPEMD